MELTPLDMVLLSLPGDKRTDKTSPHQPWAYGKIPGDKGVGITNEVVGVGFSYLTVL